MESHKKAELICNAAFEKKAEDIVVMDMKQRSGLCDVFVVMSAPSTVRVKAIVDHVEETLKQEGIRPIHAEGYAEATWILLDYGDVIVHVFHQDTRQFYGLERLWGDAPARHFSKQEG